MNAKPPTATFECLDDIPLHWVRANQIGILVCIAAALVTQTPWMLAAALLVQLISRWFGIKYNLFVRLFSRWLPASSKTESLELLRFNNLLAILFLLGSFAAFIFQATITAYIILAMLTVSVVLALSGFCLGCFMYYHWKQFRSRRLDS